MGERTEVRAAATRVVQAARNALAPDLLVKSGRALYAPASTLTRASPVYFLGINPGETPGGEEEHDLLTVDADLTRLENDAITEHGYLDETWKGYAQGEAPMQRRAQQVFSILAGGDQARGAALLRRTPTSNMLLIRSKDVNELVAMLRERDSKAGSTEVASWCWNFHRAVIEETQPQIVLTHAVTVARALTKRWKLGDGELRASGWGGTLSTCYAWRLPEGPMLLAIPNLGRYQPDGPREGALQALFEEFAPAILPAKSR